MNKEQGLTTWKLIGLLFIGGLVIWFALGLINSDEKAIKKQINKAVNAAEDEDLLTFLSVFSKEYQDSTGIVFGALYQLGQVGFARYEDIDIDISQMKITLDGNKAEVSLRIWGEATQAATMGEGKLPIREAFDQQNVTLSFVKAGGEWLIDSSRHLAIDSALH